MNRFIIIGIIAAIVIIGIGISYSSIIMSNNIKNPTTTETSQNTETTGRNLTINLNEGLNLRASP